MRHTGWFVELLYSCSSIVGTSHGTKMFDSNQATCFFGSHFSSNGSNCCWCTPLIRHTEMEKLPWVHTSFTETHEKNSPKWKSLKSSPHFSGGSCYQLRFLVNKNPKENVKRQQFWPQDFIDFLLFRNPNGSMWRICLHLRIEVPTLRLKRW